MSQTRLIVGITGASGAIYGIRILQILYERDDVETSLVVSKAAWITIQQETNMKVEDIAKLADRVYDIENLSAPIASGSALSDGMIVAPCSIKTLSSVANSYCDNLLTRAADVTLKERRRLVLVTREAPLHAGHIRLMQLASESGAIIFPPVPAFYALPRTIEDFVSQTALRVLLLFGIQTNQLIRWDGLEE